MLAECSSLVQVPALHATELATECYRGIFQGCTALTQEPVLPATELAPYCYNQMFYWCTSLTQAPELPATTLVEGCYKYMFYGDSSLNYVKSLATNITATDALYQWLGGVATTGTFVKKYGVSYPTGISGIPSGWTVQNVGYSDYLTFIALEDSTFKFSRNAMQYSIDNGTTWTTLAANTASPTVTAGNNVMWKQTGLTPNSNNGIGTFSATGNFNVQGNVMSLIYGDDFKDKIDLSGKNYAFSTLFNANTKVVSAKNLVLPATTLARLCYDSMFINCTSLTTAPELPAETNASAFFSFTSFSPTTMDESFFLRIAMTGGSAVSITSVVFTMVICSLL